MLRNLFFACLVSSGERPIRLTKRVREHHTGDGRLP